MLHVSPSPEPSLVPGPAVNPHSHVHPHAGHFNISAGGSNTVNTGNSLTSNNKACGVGNLGTVSPANNNDPYDIDFEKHGIAGYKTMPSGDYQTPTHYPCGQPIGFYGVASYDPAGRVVTTPITKEEFQASVNANIAHAANLAKKSQENPRTRATTKPVKPTKPILKKQDDYTPHGSDDRSESTPCVNDGPDNYVFPAALHRLTGWFTGRTAREKKEKEAAERSRIAMGRYRARIAYENERKTAAFSALSNLQENNTRLGALFSPAKTIPYKAPDQPSSHSGDSQHLYLSDEGRARLLENQLIRMYGKKAVDELIRKNIELDDARAEREKAESQRDLVLAESSRSRYEFGFEGRVPSRTPEEQAVIDQSLTGIPENIVDLADQAAKKVEDLKSSHPFYQGANPPKSPNHDRRLKAAFDLCNNQNAEKKKAEEVEKLAAQRLESEERAAEQDREDTKSGKKLAKQVLSLAIGGLSGSAPKSGGGPVNPSQSGSASATISEYGAVVISYPKAAISTALANISARLFGRGPSSSVGSGGSKTPEEPEVKEQEFKSNEHKPLTNKEAAELAKKLGYLEDKNPPFNAHGQKAFKKGNKWITPDRDGHIGGTWKMFEKNGSKVSRTGTWDSLLAKILGK